MPDSSSSSSSNNNNNNNNNNNDHSQYQALFDSIPQSGLKCDILFLVMKNRIREEPEYVKKMRAIFLFHFTKNGRMAATWTCDTRTTLEGDIYRGLPKNNLKADCIMTVDDDDWLKIMAGKLNPQRAFMMSKFKIKGNIMLLQKLHALWYQLRRAGKTPELDLVQEIMVNEQLLPGLKSESVAMEIVQRIIKLPHLVASIDANIQLDVLKDGKLMTQYMIGMHPGCKPQFWRLYNSLLSQEERSKLASGGSKATPSPDVTFTVEDDDLVLIVYGIHKVDASIECGRLKVAGNYDLVEQAKTLQIDMKQFDSIEPSV